MSVKRITAHLSDYLTPSSLSPSSNKTIHNLNRPEKKYIPGKLESMYDGTTRYGRGINGGVECRCV